MIRDLFNTTGPSHQASLDVGKCIDSMDTFLTVGMLATRLGLCQYLEPNDTPTLAKPLFLFMDQSELHTVISDNRAGGRPGNIPIVDLDELLAVMEYDDSEGIEPFHQQDTDIRATQELMIGNTSGNPIGNFRRQG